MIKIYTWKTPNGYKPLLLLEEIGVDYEVIQIPLDGTQKSEEFLKLNPNGKIPAMVDTEDDITIFESGAILIYLAEKYNKFLPNDIKEKYNVIQWLMFQMGGVGPMFGQLFHFENSAKEKIQYGIDRYKNESKRLIEVINERLKKTKYIASDEYTIADISIYPWIKGFLENKSELFDNMDKIKEWSNNIENRVATQKVYNINFEELKKIDSNL